MNYGLVLDETEVTAIRAQDRYGDFASTHEALGVAVEEWDELRDAIRRNDPVAIERECIDLAAVLIRMAMFCKDSVAFQDRSRK